MRLISFFLSVLSQFRDLHTLVEVCAEAVGHGVAHQNEDQHADGYRVGHLVVALLRVGKGQIGHGLGGGSHHDDDQIQLLGNGDEGQHEAGDEAVRAGIAMYGVSPDGNISSASLGIDPVMTLESEIIAFQDLQPGEACGYGSKFIAHRPTRLAVVACGYADGYPRKDNPHREVVVEGKKVPVIGNVSMDMLTIDVTDQPNARLGSKVEIWGKNLPVNEVAKGFGTIGYELLCDVNQRVPRVLIK